MKKIYWVLLYMLGSTEKKLETYVHAGDEKRIFFESLLSTDMQIAADMQITADTQITADDILRFVESREKHERVCLLAFLARQIPFRSLVLLEREDSFDRYSEYIDAWFQQTFWRYSSLKKCKIINSDAVVAELYRLYKHTSLSLQQKVARMEYLFQKIAFDRYVEFALAEKINAKREDLRTFILTECSQVDGLLKKLKSLRQEFERKRRFCEKYPELREKNTVLKNENLSLSEKNATIEKRLLDANSMKYYFSDAIWYDFIVDEGRLEKVAEYSFVKKAEKSIHKILGLSRIKKMFRIYSNRRDLALWDKDVHECIGYIHFLGLERARKENSDELEQVILDSAKNHFLALDALPSKQGVKVAVKAFFQKVPISCQLYDVGKSTFPFVGHLRKRKR